MRHIICISGKDSAATAVVQMARDPGPDYELLFCDVGAELPATYEWIDQLACTLGMPIIRVGKSLVEIIDEQEMLPNHARRFCTKYGKVFPLRDYIGKDRATVYFGIRSDEPPRAGFSGAANIIPRYPLVDLGIGIDGVYRILGDRGILPPAFYWDRLYAEVLRRAHPDTMLQIARLAPWDRLTLFAWRSRSNCFFCFYQRLYEWVGLLEHYPDLFARAERLECEVGGEWVDRRDKSFHWIESLPLARLRDRAGEIFNKRAKSVLQILQDRSQGSLFGNDPDLMTTTSCGLFCGK